MGCDLHKTGIQCLFKPSIFLSTKPLEGPCFSVRGYQNYDRLLAMPRYTQWEVATHEPLVRGRRGACHLLIPSYRHAYFILHQLSILLLVLPPSQFVMKPCSLWRIDNGQSFHILEPAILFHHGLLPLLTILAGYGQLSYSIFCIFVYRHCCRRLNHEQQLTFAYVRVFEEMLPWQESWPPATALLREYIPFWTIHVPNCLFLYNSIVCRAMKTVTSTDEF